MGTKGLKNIDASDTQFFLYNKKQKKKHVHEHQMKTKAMNQLSSSVASRLLA